MKKITILGGAGFIGHNLSISLVKKGYKQIESSTFSNSDLVLLIIHSALNFLSIY